MKREGRQHGMVKTIMVLPSPCFNRVSDPRRAAVLPTAGSFTRVSSKPTNHSKFTAKCTGRSNCSCCRLHPSNKSKHKSKGARKFKMVSWRDVDERPGLLSAGSSASNALSHLDGGYDHSDVDDDDQEEGFDDHEYDDQELNDLDVNNKDDECMSFCEVGLVWEQIDGDESWCLVGDF